MIAQISQKHKGLLEGLLLALIMVLIAVTAFGLGRLSALQEQKKGIEIVQPS